MTLNIYSDPDEAIRLLAQYFVQLAAERLAESPRFSVVLAGGNSPRKLYRLLGSESFRDQVDWPRVYFFLGDERYVPREDARSNYRMARENLFEPLAIAADHTFPVDTTRTPEAAAAAYQQELARFFGKGEIKPDLVLLGMGDNAHTASLFPHTGILQDRQPGVKAVQLPEQNTWRISLNAPLINSAGQIAFLVFGGDKAPAMQKVFSKHPGDYDPMRYPAQLIRADRTAWFTDTEAASLIGS